MPKADRSFSDLDVIRIYRNHLTQEEQNIVRAFFSGEEPGDLLSDLIDLIRNVFPYVDRVIALGDLLGGLLNRADIEDARTAADLINRRRRALEQLLR